MNVFGLSDPHLHVVEIVFNVRKILQKLILKSVLRTKNIFFSEKKLLYTVERVPGWVTPGCTASD